MVYHLKKYIFIFNSHGVISLDMRGLYVCHIINLTDFWTQRQELLVEHVY